MYNGFQGLDGQPAHHPKTALINFNNTRYLQNQTIQLQMNVNTVLQRSYQALSEKREDEE